jgi:hypothetical protein
VKQISWQKSSFSSGKPGNECDEVALGDGIIIMRESDAPAMVVTTTVASLRDLIRAVKADELDAGVPACRFR